MTVTSTVIQPVHPTQTFGTQTNGVTAALTNGGYVVAWTDNFGTTGSDVKFQRYDGFFNAVGSVQTANNTLAGDQVLRDVEVTPDGRITLLWTSGSTVSARSFDGVTGAAVANQTDFTTVESAVANGAQLFVTGANQLRVMAASSTSSGLTSLLEQANYNTATGAMGARTTINNVMPIGFNIVDVKAGNGSDLFAVMTNAAGSLLVSTSGTSLALPNNTSAIAKVQENVHVAFASSGSSLLLHTLIGFGSDVSTYTVSSSVNVGTSPGGGSGVAVFARQILDLGNGRLLLLWVGDSGTTPGSNVDGVYGVVFNTASGNTEGFPQLLAGVSNTTATTMADIRFDAKLMADGRVSVSYTFQNAIGFAGLDTRSMIVDPDVLGGGRTINGTAQADAFVGSAGNDTFINISANDRVNGNGGTDTVVLAASEQRQIDLADDLRFGASSGLAGIVNLVGGLLADEFYGTIGNNNLSGGGSGDKIFGRDGNDTLNGNDGNDTLVGGNGNDSVFGGIGIDLIAGNAGNDQLNGGADNDVITGNDGDDRIYGDDGVDKLQGNLGDDFIDGGAGNDFILGAAGADVLFGGTESDTINGGDGDDIIDGGAGNDIIVGGRGFNVVDGGTGTDTLSYAGVSFAPGFSGVYADLDPEADPFGSMDGFEVDDDVIINVENLRGSSGNDYLAGNASVNVLRGGEGNDILVGRGGIDTLMGGGGSDTFLFDRTNGGNDKVRDFTVGADKIGLLLDVFGDINAGNIDARFVKAATGAPAANGNAQLILQTSGANAGRLTFDADGNGAGAAVIIATLSFTTATGLADFSTSDFSFLV